MKIGEPKPTEYKISELKVKNFFDKRFVQLLEDSIHNIKFEHFCLLILEKKEEEKEAVKERLIVAHEIREDEKKKITSIGTTKPETCQTFLKVIKQFIEEKEGKE